MRSRLALLTCFAALALSVTPAAAMPHVPVLRDLAVLDDPTGALTVADVAATDPRRFTPVGDALAEGFSRAAHWLRFTVDAPAGEWWLDIQPPYLDDLRLFERAATGGFTERRAGDLLPFSAREVAYRGFVFKLHKAGDAPQTYFLRAQSVGTALLVPRIWAPAAFHERVATEYGVLIGLIGTLLTVIVLNALTWFYLREKVYLLFIGSLLGLTMMLIGNGGFAAQYLLPDHPAVTNAWVGVASLLAVASGAPFYREVLQVTPADRPWYALFRIQAWLPIAGIVPLLLGYHIETMRVLNVLVLVMVAVNLTLAVRSFRAHAPGGGILLAAILLTLTGITVSTLHVLGVSGGHVLRLHALNFASVCSVLTLHVAISARSRALREERRRVAYESVRDREIRDQQERFIDLVMHEYRTPLAILRTHLDVLGLTRDDEQRAGSLRAMGVAVRRLGALFDSSMRGGEWDRHRGLTIERLDPAPLLRDAVAQSEASATPDAPTIELVADDVSSIDADRHLLATIFANLLDNARKYAPPRSRICVRLAATPTGATATFENECRASVGLSPATLVEKHTRGANATGTRGIGMGLYLVQKLAADQGGALDIRVDDLGRFIATVTFARHERVDA